MLIKVKSCKVGPFFDNETVNSFRYFLINVAVSPDWFFQLLAFLKIDK